MATSSTKFNKTDVNTAGETQDPKYNGLEDSIAANQKKFSSVGAPVASAAQVGPAAQINTANSDQDRAAQLGLTGLLQAQANGTGPSLASGVLARGTDRILAGQAALAASNPTANPALAAHQLATNAVGAGQNLAFTTAQQRMQEQINAQNQLGNVIGNTRSQDLGLATGQTALDQQVLMQQAANQQAINVANQNAGLTQNAQNLQGAIGFTNSLGQTINSQAGAQQAAANQQIQQAQWVAQQQAAQDAANNAGINGMIGAGIGAAGSIASGGLSAYLKKPGA